jgi:hypothetical protein
MPPALPHMSKKPVSDFSAPRQVSPPAAVVTPVEAPAIVTVTTEVQHITGDEDRDWGHGPDGVDGAVSEEVEELGRDKWERLRDSEGPAQGSDVPPVKRTRGAPFLEYSHSCQVCGTKFRCVPKIPPRIGDQPLEPATHGCRCLNHYYNYFLCSNKCFWRNNGSHPY